MSCHSCPREDHPEVGQHVGDCGGSHHQLSIGKDSASMPGNVLLLKVDQQLLRGAVCWAGEAASAESDTAPVPAESRVGGSLERCWPWL